MAKVYPYHSTNPTDPDVYHDHSNCPPGNQIPDRNRAVGQGNNRRCDVCKSMD